MKPKSQEKGQALIIIALAAVGLFAFAALAIDGSRIFSDRRNAQNAADTAVLAAALAKVRGQDYSAAAIARAASNGYANDADSSVEVHLCSETGITCQGLPAGADPSEYIQVRIVSTIPTTFARVIGRETVTSAVEAIAHVSGSSSTAAAVSPAVVGLRQTNCAICSGGNVFLDVNGSGVFSNSTSSANPCSMDFVGTGTYDSEGGFTMATGGTMCTNPVVTTITGSVQSGAQVPYPPNIDIPAPSFTCSGTGSVTGTTVNPGNFASRLTINLTGTYTFTPGNYCFSDGVDIAGTVNVIANDVNIRIDGGEFRTNGNSGLTCSNLLVYGAGGTGIHLNGNGNNTCTGVTFYMQSGDVTWNGNSAQTLQAPTSGTYKGLLIYLPFSNGSQLKINGNSGNQLTGSIIAPGSEIILSGNSGSSGYNTQIIGSYITLQGNSNTVINYDPNAQYGLPDSPIIEFTK